MSTKTLAALLAPYRATHLPRTSTSLALNARLALARLERAA